MKPTPTDVPNQSLFYQTVEQLAHYLYVLRGCQEGRDLNDWIEAETELKNRLWSEEI